MRILDLALKDLRQILREKQSAFFLLIMPIVFTLLFGFAFGGFSSGGDEDDPRLPVGFLNGDEGVAAQHLVALLAQSELVRLEAVAVDEAELAQQVAEGEWAAAVVVPPDFSAQMGRETAVPFSLIVNPADTTGFTVQGEIEAAATRLANALQTARISTETAAAQTILTDEDAYFEQALAQAVAAWSTPPLQVHSQGASAAVEGGGQETAVYSDNAFAHTSPGMMAQFTMAGLITAAQILVSERKSGALRRLLTTNLSRFNILVGHYLAMFMLIIVQLLILILFGQLLLKLPYFQEPVATLLLVVASAAFAASMGLLIGTLSRSEEQAIIFSLLPMFLLAGLGGAWMPLEFTPESVQRIAYLTPLAWMMDGFKDIIVRGLGLESVLVATAVLLLYALALWLLAVWRFRFE
ncbi:MAG: ABC transporter permease [Ardenticatenaceae bacterium]|nr:ABC transporter permease [Ardenticatenaceae bacterium]